MNYCSHLMFSMRRRVSPKEAFTLDPSYVLPSLNFRKLSRTGTCCFPPGEYVAQFKFTVLLMPNGPMRITSGPFEPDLYKSEMEVQDAELKVSVGWKMVTMGHLPVKFLSLHFSELSSSCLPGSPPEFCKSKNTEKEEKEGVCDLLVGSLLIMVGWSSPFSAWSWCQRS